MSNKRKLLIALAGFLVAAAMAIPVEAYPYPEGDCPGNEEKGGGWDLIKVKKAECEWKAKKVDKHGNCDQWVCELVTGNGEAKYRDNDK